MLSLLPSRPAGVRRCICVPVAAQQGNKGSRRIYRKSKSKFAKQTPRPTQSQQQQSSLAAPGPSIVELLCGELDLPQFYAEQVLLRHPNIIDVAYDSAKADVHVLTGLFKRSTARDILFRCPTLLGSRLILWRDFFASYGLSTEQMCELLLESPEVLAQSSLYDAGRAILLLREFGFSNQEIVNEFIKPVPHFLTMDLEAVVTVKAPLLPVVVRSCTGSSSSSSSSENDYSLKECIYIWVHHQSVLSRVRTKQQAACTLPRW